MRLLFALGRALRPWLDRLYDACGAIAALFLLTLLAVIVLQMAARWSGQQFPGSTDYAGYCMAAASFFALAYALNRGAHIRVSLLLSTLGRWRRAGELWCFGIGSALACYFAYYAIKAVRVSYQLHDISQGQDATPLVDPAARDGDRRHAVRARPGRPARPGRVRRHVGARPSVRSGHRVPAGRRLAPWTSSI